MELGQMNCTYCDQIAGSGADYSPAPAKYDLGSYAPRCDSHWRYLCGNCGEPAHYYGACLLHLGK